MAANMNIHETFSGVISFEEMNFSKSTTENNIANNLTEGKEEEANIYDWQGNIPYYGIQIVLCFFHHIIMGSLSSWL